MRLPLTLAALFAVACETPSEDSDSLPVATVGIEVTQSTYVANVVTVAWSTEEPSTGTVTATAADGETWSRSTEEEAVDHAVTVIGLPDGTELDISIEGVSAVSRYRSEPTAWQVPQSWPALAGLTAEGEAGGFRLTTTIHPEDSEGLPGVVLLDDRGRVIWGTTAGGANHTSARFSADQRWIYTVSDDAMQRFAVDGSETVTDDTEHFHHDLLPLPDGRLLAIARTDGVYQDTDIQYDRLLRYELDGTPTVLFDVLENLNLLPPVNPEKVVTGADITHANALAYDEPTGDVLLGVAGLGAIVRLASETGEVRWILGPYGSPAPSAPVEVTLQHQMLFTPDGIAVFANNSLDYPCGQIIDYTFDDRTGHVEVAKMHRPELCIETLALGGLTDADEGRRAISWSTAGMLDVIDSDGNQLSRIYAPLGLGFGYLDWTDSLYPVNEDG